MRRPLWLRVLIACWAFWLGAALSEPAALSACPAHSSHAAHSAHTMHSDDGAMANAPHAAHDAAHHGSSSDNDSTKHCSCLGECCCTPSVAPTTSAIATLPPLVVERIAVAAIYELAPTAAAPYSHPFANGPPSDFVA